MIKDLSHPYPAVLAAEVKKWFAGRRPALTLGDTIGKSKLNW